MRRLALILLCVAGLGAFVLTTGAGDGAEKPGYAFIFDNASGLVEGADFRVGGVTVGAIKTFEVAQDARAKVTVDVTDTSFGRLRDDAFCKIAQQSLIGEYYIECEPGTKGRELENGATVPIEQTASPIASDLVQNVMRRPYRERLSIILSEFGAGFASRGEDVNATIRRGVPALQETQRVLKVLGDNRKVLRRLAADSGQLMKVLGARRKDVSRFISQAGETASVTAERRNELQATFRNFPGFLAELTPTLRDLGTAARGQAPALRDLRVAAPSVATLLDTLPPFMRASEPAVTSLADASRRGREAVTASKGTLDVLKQLGARSPEPANNLRFVAEHLDDRSFAVNKDPDSPGGQGYTGLEAILQYPFDQTLAINIFDTRGYTLKLAALINECTDVTNKQEALEDLERYKRCFQGLGPNQPGITTPDPSATTQVAARSRRDRTEPASTRTPQPAQETTRSLDPEPETPAPTPQLLPDLLDDLPDVLPGKKPPTELLDFLLGT
jgi:virulence factor Mce-like protein